MPAEILAEVLDALHGTPRRLPTRLLYDDLGSALFEAICELPWYPITRAEQTILRVHGAEILTAAGNPAHLIELGPGSGAKLETLLRNAGGHDIDAALVDLSPAALAAARQRLEALANVQVRSFTAEYLAGLAAALDTSTPHNGRMVLLLGSNIGNFGAVEAEIFLRAVRELLATGDRLLLGADLVKPVDELTIAYDDPLGVSAAFSRNLLVRLNRECGADFDVRRFVHRARWNAAESRMEMHLVSTQEQRVTFDGRDSVDFTAGDAIWTESSYKYTPDSITAMLRTAGFAVRRQWTDDGFCETAAVAN